jgi:hypothetical protein
MRFALLRLAVVISAGCRPHAAVQRGGTLPRIGLAVSDSARAWCAEFVADSAALGLEPGQRATIVFAGPAPVAALPVRVGNRQEGECPAAFPQPRWMDYVAYRVELLDSVLPETDLPTVALIVVGDALWARGADSVPRADLDGDGNLEAVRRCTADEGEHLTLWSIGRDGVWIRRWHEYYDWGGLTDPTCRPGEITLHQQGDPHGSSRRVTG